MRDDYPTYRRVFVVATLADPAHPTSSEILGGSDISACLTPDGLNLAPTNESIERTLWHDRMKTSRPTRFGWEGATLTAERETAQALWELAVFRSQMWLVVLIGPAAADSWLASTAGEVYRIEFGLRSPDPHQAEMPITFTVPLYVAAYYEVDGLVFLNTIDDETGEPILDESGQPLLAESV